MRIPTLAVRSLTLAIGLCLSVPSFAADVPPVIEGVMTISTSQLPLPPQERLSVMQRFDTGTPVLLHRDGGSHEDLAHASALFGIAPTQGDVLLRRDNRGAISVFSSAGGAMVDPLDLVSAMLAGMPEPASTSHTHTSRADADASSSDGSSPLPGRHFDVNFVDANGEISGVTGIDVVRSRTVSTDNKMILLTSKATVRTTENGVVNGNDTKTNLWGAYLPVEYRLRHTLTANGVTPTYLNHFPETDGRTEYTQVDTQKRGFSIGGSTGAEMSGTGAKDDVLAAKVPFNASFGYQYEWTTSLSMSFLDYSLLVYPDGNNAVQWKAVVAPRLKDVLLKHWGAGIPPLTEDKMTPMMRAMTFNAVSQWKLPGAYEGLATVTVSAGYKLDRKEWWWNRTNVRERLNVVSRDVATDFVLDMSDPYISAEITVLIRSALGSGMCLRDNGGNVDLAACNATDRRQMWGLNASSQYVNRGSRDCLAVDPLTRNVVTVGCKDAQHEKQWQWRADRLHSLANHGDYRLYVAGGQVRYHAVEGQFQDYPVNPHASPLLPWTNYPNSPRPGIDMQPAPAGGKPLPIQQEWASQFRPVSDDQRWRVEVLRQGL